MYNSPPKRHGLFCRFRSIIVRRSARFQVTNVQMATGGSFPVSTGKAQYNSPASARGSLPHFSPSFVGGDDHISLPQIPDLPSPTAAQSALPSPTPNELLQQNNPDDEPATQNSVPTPTQQAGYRSPAVTYLSLDERHGESDIPSHDLMTDVEYDSALSTPLPLDGDRSPAAFPPANDASSLPRGRMLARKDGRMPLRPASADAVDDPTDAPASMHAPILASDQSHDDVEATKDLESSDGQSAMQETMPETLTHAFVHVGKAPDGRLPGLMLRIVVGSQSAGNPLFDDAMMDASRACAIYGHELTQLSLIIIQDVQIDDGRDALNAVLEYLQEHLRRFLSFDLQMPKERNDKCQDSTKRLASALTQLRYLRVDGYISGVRLVAFPTTRLSELYVMAPACALDVLKLVRAFPGIDLMEFSSIGLKSLIFPSEVEIGPRPSDTDFPSIMYMKADVAALPCIIEHIPRQVQLCVTLSASSLRTPFENNAAWSLQFPSAHPSLIFP